MSHPLHTRSARDLREMFCSGDISAEEITKTFLGRIDKYDSDIGAFLAIFHERALTAAVELDRKRASGRHLGKLAGVPIAIKDNIHVDGQLTTCASKFLTNYRAPFAATAVRLLEEEDAIILGKTNLDEFGMGSSTENSALQKTYNPWNLSCVPGGSSGGSAAAVAARLCPLALGTDTGGSIRQPASFCGVAGFKPTYGRVSRYGVVAFASSLDQIGPLAASSHDLSLAMEVLGRHCPRDATSLPIPPQPYTSMITGGIAGAKVGVPWHFLENANSEVQSAIKQSIDTLKQLGATIVEVDLDLLKYSLAIYYILATAEASTNLARFDGIRYGVRSPRAKSLAEVYDFSRADGFGPEVKRRILLGTYVLSAGYRDAYYRKAQKVRTLIIEKYREAFSHCDVIAMPAAPTPAFPLGAKKDPLQMYLEDIYTIGVSLAGLPAVTTPCGFSKDGMPIGLQLIAPQKEDGRALRFAHCFESATAFHTAVPHMIQEGAC